MRGTEGQLVGGRYQLGATVGRGGMGRVWRARDVTLDREVAVKELLIPGGLSAQEHDDLIARTMREARAAARLRHTGIITIHDVVEDGGVPWVVMEFVDGPSLAKVIKDEGRLSPERVAAVGADLADALAHAHSLGIVHRDLKPDNVLLQGPRAVITDFGIAKIMDVETRITHTGIVVGTPKFMSPEQLENRTVEAPSDVWSLGVTLYSAVEGRPPFEGGTLTSLVTAILTQPLAPLEHAGALGPVLAAMLAKDADQRPDAHGVRDRLRSLTERTMPYQASGQVPAPIVAPVPQQYPALQQQPTPQPFAQPTPQPFVQPSQQPTPQPTPQPFPQPTPQPFAAPVPAPVEQRFPAPQPTIPYERTKLQEAAPSSTVEQQAQAAVQPGYGQPRLYGQRQDPVDTPTGPMEEARAGGGASGGPSRRLLLGGAAVVLAGGVVGVAEMLKSGKSSGSSGESRSGVTTPSSAPPQSSTPGTPAKSTPSASPSVAALQIQAPQTFTGHTGKVFYVTFDPTAPEIATASGDKTVRLWDTRSHQQIAELDGHTGPVYSVGFSPDGTTLGSGGADGTVRLWDAASAKTKQVLKLPSGAGLIGPVVFSPAGGLLAVGSNDGAIRLYDTDGNLKETLKGHTLVVQGLAFNADGSKLVSGSNDKTARLWDVAQGSSIATLTGHTDEIHGVAFSPDGSTVGTACFDKTARLWDVASHTTVQTLTGHTDRLESIAFSADGSYIATGGWDTTTRLWDAKSYKTLQILNGHSQTVESVAFSKDSSTLASCGWDQTIVTWKLH